MNSLQHDNAANQANFDEIQAHINAVQERLKTAAGEQRELLLADHTDYYERLVQHQKMAKDTFMLERDEARKNCKALLSKTKEMHRQKTLLSAILIFVVIGVIAYFGAPAGSFRALLSAVPIQTIAPYALCCICTVAVCKMTLSTTIAEKREKKHRE